MTQSPTVRCTAFVGPKAIASGHLRAVAERAKAAIDRDRWAQVLIFDDVSSELIEVDFRGSAADVVKRIDALAGTNPADDLTPVETGERRPGRPKLGVVAREVTASSNAMRSMADGMTRTMIDSAAADDETTMTMSMAPATVRKTPRVRPNHVHVASDAEMPAKARAKFW